MDVFTIIDYVNSKTDEISIKKAQRDNLIEKNDFLNKKISELEEEITLNQAASLLIKTASRKARAHAINTCENIVTVCLRDVFMNDMKFIIKEFEDRKTPQIEFYLTDEKGDESNLTLPTESRGGGVVDIVALGLRIAINQLLYGENNFGPLVFDEPAKYVSLDYIGNVGLFLKQFSKDFDRQIIMVTHDAYLSNISDSIFTVDKNNMTSEIIKDFNSDNNALIIDNWLKKLYNIYRTWKI